jgi:uncharacterized membrane protein YphA (DoxX/SURF4 family)
MVLCVRTYLNYLTMFINPFPTMFLALIAHAVLRVVFGLTLFWMGYKHLTQHRMPLARAVTLCAPRLSGAAGWLALYFAAVELIAGAMFIMGAYTQIAALITVAYALKMLFFRKRFTPPLVPSPSFYVLAIGVSLSLFITGAGIFALDIPL